ncbi:hypothetical protein ACFE04_029617 [Oxalis oulophora]
MPMQPYKRKNVENIQLPMKPATLGRFVPPTSDNNLVIRFSDDDSGSDIDDNREKKALNSKPRVTSMDNKRKPLTSAAEKLNLGQNPNVIPKKAAMARTFVSPSTKFHGVNSKVTGPIPQQSHVRNFKIVKENSVSPDPGCGQGVGQRQSKLQDLRQQIALRESELKLKAAQLNKESVSVLCKDDIIINPTNDAARKFKSTDSPIGEMELRQPNPKRLKVSESGSLQMTCDGPKESICKEHVSLLTELVPENENDNLQLRDKVECGNKTLPSSKTELAIVEQKKQNDKDGTNIISICNASERRSREADPINESEPVASNLAMSPFITDSNPPSKAGPQHTPNSHLKESARGQNLININQSGKFIQKDRTIEPHMINRSQASFDNASCWNRAGDVNMSGPSDMSMQTLIEMEDTLDKELGEAQEHRRLCEIEERNALKAYRKAQRALIEANARCSTLYSRRELCSARYRSLITNDTSLLWSSGQHEHIELGLNNSFNNNMTENMDLIQPDYVGINEQRSDSNLQHVKENRRSVGLEQSSEPGASTSDALPNFTKTTANALSSPSIDLNDEDDETFRMDDESARPSINFQEKQNDLQTESNTNFLADASQDSLLLEATLRSKLFARLKVAPLSKKNNSPHSLDPVVESGGEFDKIQISNGNEAKKDQQYNFEGVDGAERSFSESSVQTQVPSDVEKSSKSHSPVDFEDGEFLARNHHPLASLIISPPLILRSTFTHMKVESPVNSLALQTRSLQNHTDKFQGLEGSLVSSDGIWSSSSADSVGTTLMGPYGGAMGSYTNNHAMDPFWPICIFELRGKCNNDECPWQHLKERAKDHQVGVKSYQKIFNGVTKLSKSSEVCTPTYLVAMDMLKADRRSFENLTARKHERCWQKCFSSTLALSCLFQKDLMADEPLQSTDGRIEIHGSLSQESSYLRKTSALLNQLKQAAVVGDQSLETALLILNQEVYKLEAIKKALNVISRALEADPTSEILWIAYLLIYYGTTNSVGKKDDMFSLAVKKNESSYVLWLMCINSRTQLDDRLLAYEAALSSLYHQSHPDKDPVLASACILDLFLQMINCLFMSGNIEKAIHKILELFPAATRINTSNNSRLLSNIPTCLTLPDRCVLWVCCVYLVVYRKLPDAVVKLFECEKELLSIEWPSVQLATDQKQKVLELLETAAGFIQSNVDYESPPKMVQHFALCHIRCMVALDGFECGMVLLDKYFKLFPSSLELVLLSARAQKHVSEDSSFAGFEEAFRNWPKEAPGIQCIWYQYVENALENEQPNFAKEVICRWFHSVYKVEHFENEISSAVDSDLMFEFLNRCLYDLLHDNHKEAQVAVDRALKAATHENFKHCVREHAVFLLTHESQLKGEASFGMQLEILKGYLDNARKFSASKPLVKHFLDTIEKPRVHQLISNILCPLSSDFSLVNLVLDAWYGPTLLPQNLINPKDVVEFAEAILDLVPSNYELMLSVCKMYKLGDSKSASFLFWASSALTNAIFHAVPVAPEYAWVEAADILGSMKKEIDNVSRRFFKKALSRQVDIVVVFELLQRKHESVDMFAKFAPSNDTKS